MRFFFQKGIWNRLRMPVGVGIGLMKMVYVMKRSADTFLQLGCLDRLSHADQNNYSIYNKLDITVNECGQLRFGYRTHFGRLDLAILENHQGWDTSDTVTRWSIGIFINI